MEPPIIFEDGYQDQIAQSASRTEKESFSEKVIVRVASASPTHADRRPLDARNILHLSRPRGEAARTPSVEIDDWAVPKTVRVPQGRQERFTSFVLRSIDIVISLFALLLFLPLLLLVAISIKLDSRGPILFMQERIGYFGTSFRMFKFRSMTVGAELLQAELWADNERDGPVFKIKKDPRITRLGHLLRHYSIDELPQLLNVLIGDMSLVGPRPALPMEVAMYTPRQMQRLGAIPGITGLWQISGRANLSFDQSVELDLAYIRHQSIKLYLSILLKTIPIVIKGDGAY